MEPREVGGDKRSRGMGNMIGMYFIKIEFIFNLKKDRRENLNSTILNEK